MKDRFGTSGSRLSRRDVLLAGAAAAGASLAAPGWAASAPTKAKRCIFILCTGGPSQLETWDPKPEAAAEVRGPFGAVSTNVPGLRISEILPRLARQADRYAVVRSVQQEGPAVHEVGQQWIQTGRAFGAGEEWPSLGSVFARLRGPVGPLPAAMVLPRPVSGSGLGLPTGDGAGFLGTAYTPLSPIGDPADASYGVDSLLAEGEAARRASGTHYDLVSLPAARRGFDVSAESEQVRERYGRSTFGQSCLLARRLVEHGAGFVTVNQFDSLFHQHTWDCHGFPDLPTRVADLRDHVAAQFDQAVSALIEDLSARGLYEETLVCCFGEFGRAPVLSSTGGREHWTRCWSVMLGGGGIRGGQVVGASDARGAEPVERPVTPADLAATVYSALGIDPGSSLAGADGARLSLLPAGAAPIRELL